MKKQKLKGDGYYYALLCYGCKGDPLICGVYDTKKEAKEVNKEIGLCCAKHKIKKVRITIEI